MKERMQYVVSVRLFSGYVSSYPLSITDPQITGTFIHFQYLLLEGFRHKFYRLIIDHLLFYFVLPTA